MLINISGGKKTTCRLCQKSFTCTDGKMKLTTSTLKVHLLKAHNTNTEVRAAYLLNEAEKMVGGTRFSYFLAKIIEFFEFVLSPKILFNYCIPDKIFKFKPGIRTPVPSFLRKNV